MWKYSLKIIRYDLKCQEKVKVWREMGNAKVKVLQTDLCNKNLSQHVTVGMSPDRSHDPGSLSGLCKQLPDRSNARSPAQSRVKSLALLSVGRLLTSARDRPEPGTSLLSIEDGI